MGQETSGVVKSGFKDFAGQDLAMGDRVVWAEGGRYAGLRGPYFVRGFTPKMVRVGMPDWEKNHSVMARNLVKVPHAN